MLTSAATTTRCRRSPASRAHTTVAAHRTRRRWSRPAQLTAALPAPRCRALSPQAPSAPPSALPCARRLTTSTATRSRSRLSDDWAQACTALAADIRRHRSATLASSRVSCRAAAAAAAHAARARRPCRFHDHRGPGGRWTSSFPSSSSSDPAAPSARRGRGGSRRSWLFMKPCMPRESKSHGPVTPLCSIRP
jgi:hypothetical protein